MNTTDLLIVERIEATEYGDALLHLSGGYRLVIFPTGTRDEAWRLFLSEGESEHLVIDGPDVCDTTMRP